MELLFALGNRVGGVIFLVEALDHLSALVDRGIGVMWGGQEV